MIYYFPNLDLEHWFRDIVEDRERGFLLEVYEYTIYGTRYKMQYRIHQDFSLELLEDMVQVNETEEILQGQYADRWYFCGTYYD